MHHQEMTTNSTSECRLFVYGTLLARSAHPMAALLRQRSTPLAPGWFAGRLYDLGAYPGALYEPDSETKVFGEVLNLSPAVLPLLDRYEGLHEQPAEYVRRRVPVQTAAGPVACWAYLYCGPVSESRRILSGRYAP